MTDAIGQILTKLSRKTVFLDQDSAICMVENAISIFNQRVDIQDRLEALHKEYILRVKSVVRELEDLQSKCTHPITTTTMDGRTCDICGTDL